MADCICLEEIKFVVLWQAGPDMQVLKSKVSFLSNHLREYFESDLLSSIYMEPLPTQNDIITGL